MLSRVLTVLFILTAITIQCTFVVDSYSLITNDAVRTSESRSRQHRNRRSITRLHDTLVLQPNKSNPAKNKTRREIKYTPHTKVIPADESLHQKYFSEKVEENLGHIKINRPRRNEPTNENKPNQVPKQAQSSERDPNAMLIDKQRLEDLTEIFRILARRDGPLLEQMLSLRDSIERFYGIFEFMGVAKMPEPERDVAIRKILQRSMNIDVENAAKLARARAV